MKKKVKEYRPLRFVNNIEREQNMSLCDQMVMFRKTYNIKGDSDERIITFMLSNDFLNPDYRGEFRLLNETMIRYAPRLMQYMNFDWEHDKVSVKSELRDVYLFPMVLTEWVKMKQVYRLDPEFSEMLLETENLELSKTIIDHLPFRDFYVDLEQCPKFQPAKGIFVHVGVTATEASFSIVMLADDDTFYSYYSRGEYDENGLLNVDDIAPKYDVPYVNSDKTVTENNGVSRMRAATFTLQLLSYITAKEPDIKEDAVTKRTYKPERKVIKNTFSEIHMDNVGFYVGEKLRVLNKREATSRQSYSTHSTHERKPTRPHVRKAHWSHYWTGKGRTVYETRWIAPSYVNFSSEEEVADAVIHDVL